MHAAEIHALHNLAMCQPELQNDVTNQEKQEIAHNADMEYIRAHKLYLSFLSQKAKMNWCNEVDENTHLGEYKTLSIPSMIVLEGGKMIPRRC